MDSIAMAIKGREVLIDVLDDIDSVTVMRAVTRAVTKFSEIERTLKEARNENSAGEANTSGAHQKGHSDE